MSRRFKQKIRGNASKRKRSTVFIAAEGHNLAKALQLVSCVAAVAIKMRLSPLNRKDSFILYRFYSHHVQAVTPKAEVLRCNSIA